MERLSDESQALDSYLHTSEYSIIGSADPEKIEDLTNNRVFRGFIEGLLLVRIVDDLAKAKLACMYLSFLGHRLPTNFVDDLFRQILRAKKGFNAMREEIQANGVDMYRNNN